MRPIVAAPLLALALSACVARTGAPDAVAGPLAPAASRPAPLPELVRAIDVPYERFTLANGLTTLVHTDRKAPIVGVTVFYRVGSKHEPKGRTGFAHLFEHLMFGGSENVPSFDAPLEAAGSTATNGSTWYDRTNYVETVPTGALDLALFMESDRMGHLLGAVTQDKLDKQRGVVQNEKRQGDNEPYGLVDYAIGEGLFPVGHPYRHATIGSMADLDAADLGDVRKWFIDHYGPNNVVLALAGDIDAATARPRVERWFGDIPRGPEVARPAAGPVTLPAAVSREMADQVPVLRLHRAWSGPDLNDRDSLALDLATRVLGGLSSSRLDNALVRREQLAVAVTASTLAFEQVGRVEATMDVKPGIDRAKAEARFDAVIAGLVAEGPTADELKRAATQAISATIGQLEGVGGFGGKGAQLAEGLLYSDDPLKFKRDLETIAALTPADVRAALQRWLTRPAYKLAVVPGARTERGEAMGGWGDDGAGGPAPAAETAGAAPKLRPAPKRTAPPVAAVADLAFPQIERARLSNGIPVAFARRTTVPTVLVSLNFDAGYAADPHDALGTQSLMLALLDEGTKTRDSIAIAEEQERLGAALSTGADLDSSAITLSALRANLAPSLALMADVARNPAFAPDQVARLKDQRLAEIAQETASPLGLARRAIGPLIYGPAHPYGIPAGGLGDPGVIKVLTPVSLEAAHQRWLRPDLARISVVGDTSLAELLPLLDRSFGDWRAPAEARPTKDLAAAVPPSRSRIVVIDRPNSPQSVIVAGRALPLPGTQANEELELANEVLGNGFLSRLNLDLREDKGWSYGVRSGVSEPVGPRSLTIAAPVQSDRTGDSLKRLIAAMKAFPASRGVEPAELNRVTDGNIRGLPNRFETSAQLLSAIVLSDRLGRPDDYYARLLGRYRAIGAAALDAAAREYLQPDGLVFVVVGDRKLIDPQLEGLGLPVEHADPR